MGRMRKDGTKPTLMSPQIFGMEEAGQAGLRSEPSSPACIWFQ